MPMRFIDYDGSGGLDSRDIATSVAVDEATHEDRPRDEGEEAPVEARAGCATMAAPSPFQS